MLDTNVRTTHAILFNEVVSSEIFNASTNTKLALTIHDIKQTEAGEVIGAGRLLSDHDKEAVKALLNNEEDTGNEKKWLPDNLMLKNSTQMVWYVPAQKRNMYIKVKDKVRTLNVWWPSMVFSYSESLGIRVAAYTGTGKPRLNQKLYHAPILNTYSSTKVCLGSAESTNCISVDSMLIWESAIFDTVFTHKNHNMVLQNKETSDGAYLMFMQGKVKSGDKITARDMTPLNMTLEQWA